MSFQFDINIATQSLSRDRYSTMTTDNAACRFFSGRGDMLIEWRKPGCRSGGLNISSIF